MLELIFAADGETVRSGVTLGHLQDAVAPVVGSLRVLGVVDGVVGDDEWRLEALSGVACAVSNEAMAAEKKRGSDSKTPP